MKTIAHFLHPIKVVRTAGIIEGISLLFLFGVAMPLKYWGGQPYAVTLAGSIHGGVFLVYLLAVVYAQMRLQWHPKWTLFCLLAAFVPIGNFVLDYFIHKNRQSFEVKVIPKRWLVFAIIFFTFIDLFSQLPVMSTYATSLGATAAIAGFIVGMYSLTNVFGNVISGILTDRHGAYPILAMGLIATSGVLFSYSLVGNVTGLMIVRFLHGLLGGLIVPAAFTYLANEARKDQQSSQSALSGVFVGIAAIAGPAYSGIMANKTSVPFVFATIAVVGLLLFAATLVKLRAGKAQQVREEKKTRGKLAINPGMAQAFAGAFFLMFSQGALAYLLPQHVESLGYNSRLSGMLLSTFGLVAVIMFLVQARTVLNRIPPVISLIMGVSFMGVGQILIGQSSGMMALYADLALYGLGFSFLFPAINTLLARSTTRDYRGKAYGYFYALFSAGSVAGSTGIGLLTMSIPIQFLTAGLVLFLCALFVFMIQKVAVRQELGTDISRNAEV